MNHEYAVTWRLYRDLLVIKHGNVFRYSKNIYLYQVFVHSMHESRIVSASIINTLTFSFTASLSTRSLCNTSATLTLLYTDGNSLLWENPSMCKRCNPGVILFTNATWTSLGLKYKLPHKKKICLTSWDPRTKRNKIHWHISNFGFTIRAKE